MTAPDRRRRMSTITDVAREAGVSVATVSRALRGLDRVSPRTRERVFRVAQRLDYVASPTASSLASGRTQVVGVEDRRAPVRAVPAHQEPGCLSAGVDRD